VLQRITHAVFEQLRRSLDELLARATKPEDRRTIVARMKGTLVQATLGVDDLRDGLEKSRRRLDAERRELETVRRRKQLATDISDAETVSVAEKFEKQHEERARLLEEKIAVQARELELAEREVTEMKDEIRRAMSGMPPTAGAVSDDTDALDEMLRPSDAAAKAELDAMARARAREEREADAARRLDELKKKMGQ
jgi:hypothetical protein